MVPPNIPSMDSAAGGRFQATYNADGTRASHWIPLWICYGAASVPSARALDCNVEGISRDEFLRSVPAYDIYLFFGNEETVIHDLETARQLREHRPQSHIVFCGPYSSVAPEAPLQGPGVSAVIRGEIEGPLRQLCNDRPFSEVEGLSWKDGDQIVHNPDATPLEDLDSLEWAARIIRRDLPLLQYRIPYLKYPYISIFSGRGCPYRCTYCLWPQALSGHRYRTRSIGDVAAEMLWIRDAMPMVKEIQIEDDTFTCDRNRVLALCDILEGSGITWSCCSRYDISSDVLARMKQAGVRNLVVGFESGNDEILRNVKKGLTTGQAKRFMQDCRRLGITVHGCFVFGLPGETKETMRETLAYALELKPNTVQFAIASAYEGTHFYEYLKEHGYLRHEHGITNSGHLSARFDYPNLTGEEINAFAHHAWRSYYLRPSTIARSMLGAVTSLDEAARFLHGVRYVGDYLIMASPHQKKS
jgi:radical SAM superfamily enzyme YgiQ (UPF0313 family)